MSNLTRYLLPLVAALLLACTRAPPIERERVDSAPQGLGGAGGTPCASDFDQTPKNGSLATALVDGGAANALVASAATDCTWGSVCSTMLYVAPSSGSGAYAGPSWIDAPAAMLAALPAQTCGPSFLPMGTRVVGRGQTDAGTAGTLPTVRVGDVLVFWKGNQVWHEALVLGVDSSGHYPTAAIPVSGSATGIGNVILCSSSCDTAWTSGFRTQCICAAGAGYSTCSGDTTAVCADVWDVDGSLSGTARSSLCDVKLDGTQQNPPQFPGLRY